MSKIIECVCGFVISGSDDDELLMNARKHGESHDWPELSDEELLAMAAPARPTRDRTVIRVFNGRTGSRHGRRKSKSRRYQEDR